MISKSTSVKQHRQHALICILLPALLMPMLLYTQLTEKPCVPNNGKSA